MTHTHKKKETKTENNRKWKEGKMCSRITNFHSFNFSINDH